MARAIGWLALVAAYIATLFYIAAMVAPWWYTKYYPVGSTEDAFYDANPGLDQHTGLFRMTNCFIDGSCITGGQIYKNNSSLQWVYTAVLVLMILGWIPWLIFVHLLHFRNSKIAYRANRRGLRPLMLITALLTWLFILAAFIVFAAGIVKTNGVYNSGGLYGHKGLLSQNGLVGTGRNVDQAYENINKRSSLMIKRQSGGSGGSGGTGPILPPGWSDGVTDTSVGPSAGTGSDSVSTQSTESTTTVTSTSTPATSTSDDGDDTTITPPLGNSGTESDTASASASGVSSTTTPTGFASGSTDSDFATTTAAIPVTSNGGDNQGDDSNSTFGYNGPEDARNLNLYWEPHAWGTLPYGNEGYTLLGAGIPVLDESITVDDLNGPVGYKYGANAAWYFALLALAVIPLALILGLLIAPAKTVATQTTSSTVTSGGAYVPPLYNAQRNVV